jgi:hypothetical protein
MKKLFYNKSSKILNLLKNLYHLLPLYKLGKNQQGDSKKMFIDNLKAKESYIISKIFAEKYMVFNGPFRGMKYIRKSSGSTLLPKILGSYEEPLHDWIDEVLEVKNYKKIIDIGCAEGYYAVGFAFRLPDVDIIAYDVDSEARKNISELISINKVYNVEVRDECTLLELERISELKTLIFCDIEGEEIFLLDPKNVPSLKNVDIIVETHDFIFPNTTEDLIRRFYDSHKIRVVVDYPCRLKKYNSPKEMSQDELSFVVDEMRPKMMKWLYLETYRD